MIQFSRSCKLTFAATALCALAPSARAVDRPVRLGVYYYPGWSPNIAQAVHKSPWLPIEPYGDRMPAMGEYVDGDPNVLRTQLDAMKAGGLSFVVFDSYVSGGGKTRADQSINAYMAVADSNDPQFSILWDNSDQSVKSMSDWVAILSVWCDRYFRDSRYVRVDGRPMLMIFSASVLDATATRFGVTGGELLVKAQAIAKAHGLPGIFFVAGSPPNTSMARGRAASEGYSALSEYNLSALGAPGAGYLRRDGAYQRYWKAYTMNASVPAILPLTVGWDRTPWGGSKEDGAVPTPEQFATHVAAALSYMRRGETQASRMGVICCWNEYGEGSILEPTRKMGSAYLQALRGELNRH